ncbi:MAG: YutD-like domain-containing protein [Bacillota bacterium]
MLETEHGMFDLLKNYRDAFILDDFNNRYVDYFDKYKYLVGDYSAGILRLKGFNSDNYELIPDYLVESCAPNCAYYILRNKQYKDKNESEQKNS